MPPARLILLPICSRGRRFESCRSQERALPGRDRPPHRAGKMLWACRGRADGTGTGNGQRKGGRWWILCRYWACWIM